MMWLRWNHRQTERLHVSTSMVDLLTDYQIDTLMRLAREAHRRAARAAEKNRESGLVDELPGQDADAVREANLAVLIEALEEIQERALPDSFMVPAPSSSPAIPAAVYAARAERAESDRDAAEDLADRRGELLAEMARVMRGELSGTERGVDDVLSRVEEHLRVTGEIDAGD